MQLRMCTALWLRQRFCKTCLRYGNVVMFLSISLLSSAYASCGAKQCLSNANRWECMSSPEISRLQMVILPLGSTESHGPHLPLGTDAILASELAMKAAEGQSDVAILPLSSFGASFEHMAFPGTIAIRDDILNSFWGDVTTSIVRSGVKKLLFVNGHGGQTSNVQIVIRNARFEYNVLAVSFNIQAMLAKAYAEIVGADLSTDEIQKGIHGGLIETSVMLHLHPKYVHVDELRNFRPHARSHFHLEPYGSIVSYGWRMEDLCPEGAVGNAQGSSSELGSQIFERSVAELRGVIEEMIKSDLKEHLEMKDGS